MAISEQTAERLTDVEKLKLLADYTRLRTQIVSQGNTLLGDNGIIGKHERRLVTALLTELLGRHPTEPEITAVNRHAYWRGFEPEFDIPERDSETQTVG